MARSRRFSGMRSAMMLALAAAAVSAQTFEVASIKPSAPGMRGYSLPPAKVGRFSAGNVTLKMLIGEAWSVQEYQVDGGPPWAATDRYDIEAKYTGKTEMARTRAMIQAMLVERFHLQVRHEQREMQAYM